MITSPNTATAHRTASTPAPVENLTAETFHGLKWSYASTFIIALLQILFVAVMARLLTPADFGLMAMAGVVISFGNYFARMGIGSAVVQKETLSREEIHAAFLLSSGFGVLTAAGTYLAAPAAALLFNQPDVVPIVQMMALSFLLTGISISAYNLLRRNLNFRAVAIVDVLSYVLGYGIVGIGMAYLDYGVWSLVGASLSLTLIGTVLAHLLVRHGFSFVRRWESYRPLFSFGSRVSVVSFFEFIGETLDTMLIGRWLGAGSLGLYSRGQALIRQPMYQLSSSFSRVLLPSFSRVQSNLPRLRKAFLTAVMLVSAVLVPTCVGLAVAAQEAVLLMLGPQWVEVIPILQVLAFAAALELLVHFSGITCEATATLNVKIVIQFVFIGILIGLFMLLRGYGLPGFAMAVLLAQGVRYAAYLVVVQRLLAIPPMELARAHLTAVVNSAVIGGALYVTAQVLRGADVSIGLAFGVEVAIGALLLGGLLFFSPVSDMRRETIAVLERINTTLSRRAARLLLHWSSPSLSLNRRP